MHRRGIVVTALLALLLSGCSAGDERTSAPQKADRSRSAHARTSAPVAKPTKPGRTTEPPAPPTATSIAVAHRGAPTDGRTENGLPALENAARLHAEMSEFDVRPTLDGELVIMHDGGLVRTTDCLGQVAGRTYADIAAHCRLDDGSPVPTLREFLGTAVARGLPLMIELKEGPGWTPEVFAQMRADMEPLSRFDDSVFLSFDDDLLAMAHDTIPELPGIWIVPRRLSVSRSVIAKPVGGFLIDGELTTDGWMRAARAHDKLVYARVVDSVEGWQRCVDIGMDGILTNRLTDYLQWRAATVD
ncbi:glycerophosphodiester phosphodiesterase [Nocardioides sp. MH1]|uniref:glycerophosphodiester phosphodiesterase n=1 Tax=Nocardioides sp. MH1 TaxID=3242490 RepID=UPI003521CC00